MNEMSAIFAGLFSVKFAPTPHPRNWAGEICGMAQRRAAAGNAGFKKNGNRVIKMDTTVEMPLNVPF